MVVGCDGLFDVMTSQEVTNFVATELNGHGGVQEAADALVKECNERNSQDNITAVVVCFNSALHKNVAVEANHPPGSLPVLAGQGVAPESPEKKGLRRTLGDSDS